MATCSEPDCDRAAAVRLHVPGERDRVVCLPHGRALARQKGVVGIPIDEADWDG